MMYVQNYIITYSIHFMQRNRVQFYFYLHVQTNALTYNRHSVAITGYALIMYAVIAVHTMHTMVMHVTS